MSAKGVGHWVVGMFGAVAIAMLVTSAASAASVYVSSSTNTLYGIQTGRRVASEFAGSDLSAAGVGTVPGDFVFSPDGETAYVITADGLLPVAPARGVSGAAIAVKASTRDSRAAITPDGKTVLVTSPSDGT